MLNIHNNCSKAFNCSIGESCVICMHVCISLQYNFLKYVLRNFTYILAECDYDSRSATI